MNVINYVASDGHGCHNLSQAICFMAQQTLQRPFQQTHDGVLSCDTAQNQKESSVQKILLKKIFIGEKDIYIEN